MTGVERFVIGPKHFLWMYPSAVLALLNRFLKQEDHLRFVDGAREGQWTIADRAQGLSVPRDLGHLVGYSQICLRTSP